MNMPSKKPSPSQPTDKLASHTTTKGIKEFIASGADQAKKAQAKVLDMGREGTEHLAQSAETITKALHETIAMSRGTIETCIECGNMTGELAKDMSGELLETVNKAFADNAALSKEFFTCRTMNDMFELQSKIVKNTMDTFFDQSSKLSNMIFEYTTEVLEPINERVAQATEQCSKALKV